MKHQTINKLGANRRQVLTTLAAASSVAWANPMRAFAATSGDSRVIRLALGPKISVQGKFWAGIEAARGNKFEQFGVKVAAQEHPSPQSMIAATLAGSADLFYADFLIGANAIKNGQKLTFVSPGNRQYDLTYFLVRKGDPAIKSPADLKGKKIGVSAAVFTHVYTAKWLQSLGLSSAFGRGKDVELIELPQNTLQAALSSGDIDAINTWDRLDAFLLRHNFGFSFLPGTESGLPVASFLQLPGPALTGSWFASNAFVEKNPDLIAPFDRAARQVAHWFVHELKPSEQRAIYKGYVRTDFTGLVDSLDAKTADELLARREFPYPLTGFDEKAANAWIDIVAEVIRKYPTSSRFPLRSYTSAHLFKS